LTKALKTREFSGTFSILAISPDCKFMGVAVASGSTFVGDRIPHARPGIGVIATQAYTNVNYGIQGLELMAEGFSPEQALDKLLKEDPEKGMRQVAVMDFERRKAVFTGVSAPEWRGEIVGDDYVVIGNLLSRKEVVNAMAKQFESTRGDLAWRMAKALKAGGESGGDKRGERSAALIVVDTEKVEVEMKVDAHKSPIEELFHKLTL
jgi:uncharacterized Ntn-hydrolase superfamily protein